MEILRVDDNGNLDREKLVLEVLNDGDAGNFVVMDATFDEHGDLSNIGRHAYKLPAKEIKRGDLIVLNTRAKAKDDRIEWQTINKTMVHAFFWGREKTVWNQGSDYCRLLRIVDFKEV